MRYLEKAAAVFLAGLLCWASFMQPAALYAEVAAPRDQAVTAEAYDAPAGDASKGSALPEGDSGEASDEAPLIQEPAAPEDAAAGSAVPENASAAEDAADTQAVESSLGGARQEGVQGAGAVADADAPADATAEGTSSDASMAYSWRLEQGELREDANPGISLFSLRSTPAGVTAEGIDVSQWNGTIDWAKVKESGVDFAILRLGYGSKGVDTQFAANVKGCKENGIPFGVYVYCYAWDAASAQSEAEGTLTRLRDAGVAVSDLSLPVYYDMENENPDTGMPSGVDADNHHHDIQGGADTFASIAATFAQALEAQGYQVGIYANLNWWDTYLTSPAFENWERWVAQYNSSCSYEGAYSAWQYTSTGSVAGVPTNVDMNYWYGDVPWEEGVGEVHITYRAHVAEDGWQNPVADGKLAGTTGEARAVEALTVGLVNQPYAGSVAVRAHVQDIGWQDYVTDGAVAGTTGQSKHLEAVQIELTDEMAKHYDVYYRVHVANIGWMGTAKNGELAGTQGYGYGIEAIQIALVEKGAAAPTFSPDAACDEAFKKPATTLQYRAHVSEIGWQSAVKDGATAGTTGRALSIEALQVSVANAGLDETGDVEVRAHVADIGWRDYVVGGKTAGTTGQAKHIEAVQIKLTGALSERYDVYYRVHTANIGWMAWAKNDEQAGTQGYGYGIEAIQIALVKKGGEAPASKPSSVTTEVFRRKPVDVSYRAHVSNIGWQGSVSGGDTAGTTGKALGLEALTVTLTNQVLAGGVQVQAHVSDIGWQGAVSSGNVAGTTGQAKHIEALRIQLTGEMADAYDVYYRVHASGYGWLGWAKNGAEAGTTGLGRSLEAVQITLVTKGSNAPGSTSVPYVTLPSMALQTYSSAGWGDSVGSGAVSGSTGQSRPLSALKAAVSSDISGVVSYRVHLSDKGWQPAVVGNEVAGATDVSYRIEAIQMSLAGNLATYFDMWYRVYVEDAGWLGWTSNGEVAGTTSAGLAVEAIQVTVLAKGSAAPTGGTGYRATYSGGVPQAFSQANLMQRKIVETAKVVPSPGAGLCSEWIADIFDRLGFGNVHLDACDYYWRYCKSTSYRDLKVGMVIAIPSHTHTTAGSIWGHVCLYIGDGKVMDNVGTIRTLGLHEWLEYYDTTYTPKWGWYNNIPIV